MPIHGVSSTSTTQWFGRVGDEVSWSARRCGSSPRPGQPGRACHSPGARSSPHPARSRARSWSTRSTSPPGRPAPPPRHGDRSTSSSATCCSSIHFASGSMLSFFVCPSRQTLRLGVPGQTSYTVRRTDPCDTAIRDRGQRVELVPLEIDGVVWPTAVEDSSALAPTWIRYSRLTDTPVPLLLSSA